MGLLVLEMIVFPKTETTKNKNPRFAAQYCFSFSSRAEFSQMGQFGPLSLRGQETPEVKRDK